MKITASNRDMAAPIWRKSTYSGGEGNNCVEIGNGHSHVVPVRDSKNPTGPKLVLPAAAWSAFIADLKQP
ncbi:DUF397 domain-containing protein [Streptomyces sp. NPDC050738]|uniref:DUF397 domain-containing protein n=1 Tax=Streptomyces sp. NPDC050738 TaxID=3154744 RepID=UPI003435DD66